MNKHSDYSKTHLNSFPHSQFPRILTLSKFRPACSANINCVFYVHCRSRVSLEDVGVEDGEESEDPAADTEDEIQRKTTRIRHQMEKERKQKVKAAKHHKAHNYHQSHPRSHMGQGSALTNHVTANSSTLHRPPGMSPTQAAVVAANQSYHSALYPPSLNSVASASTPNLHTAFLDQSQLHCSPQVGTEQR